jgi:hypothetical protein
LQTYVSIISPCFSMLQQVLLSTRSNSRATRSARTHRALPISIMRANSNSRTCTQRTVSIQMVEHSLIKVHARM